MGAGVGAEYNLGGALTDALNFTPKQPGASSRSYRTIVLPINSGPQSAGDCCKMDIPVGRPNAYIDTSETYLLFWLKLFVYKYSPRLALVA